MKQIIDPTYGRQFRKMRKSKHINLINACGNITSKSSLARWENGADNLSWNQVINLLTYNHIQLAEFIRKSASKNLDELLNPIAVAYNANQVPILKEYNMTAIISIVGEYTDRYSESGETNLNYGYMRWEDIRNSMSDGTIEFQNHTYALQQI